MSEQLLTPEEVAQLLRVTEQTVYNWLRAGELAGLKAGRLWRIRSEALEQFLCNAPNAPSRGVPAKWVDERLSPPRLSARGKYAHVPTSSEEFATSKQAEIVLEDATR